MTPQIPVRVLIPHEKLMQRIDELAAAIQTDYGSEPLILVSVLNGGMPLTCALATRLGYRTMYDSIVVKSYHGTESSGAPKILKWFDLDVTNRHVLIVEDIIDTGNTMSTVLQKMRRELNPKSIKLCSLLNKPSRREITDLTIDYCGFEIANEFVVGFGLDYNDEYRGLDYIGVIEAT